MFNLVLKKHDRNREQFVAMLPDHACINNNEAVIAEFIQKARSSGLDIDPELRIPVHFIYEDKQYWHLMNIREFVYYRNRNIDVEQKDFSIEMVANQEMNASRTA
jgi:hypothetical protein